ncbi:MAG: energy-coupled thiamine transporter ThiT [Spiroplasma sp.]|nr:energy-coupled thiamine transporter ThiT [Spiroplasma sp.]
MTKEININPTNNYLWLKITSVVNAIIFLTLFLLTIIINNQTLNQLFQFQATANDWTFFSLKIFLSLILGLIIIIASLWVMISFKNNWILAIKNNLVLSFLLVSLTLNFYGCWFVINQQKEKEDLNLNWCKRSLNLKKKLGIKKWLTIDYVLIAFFCALTITFSFIEENLLPHLPFGGGLGIKYLPLILISFLTSFAHGWLTGFISALMALLFIPAANIISPWSFILDYFLPMTAPAIIAFLPSTFKEKTSIFTYINYFSHCFLVLLLVYFYQFLSGYFLWTTAFPTSVWTGYSAIWYSLIYNFIHIFLFTYPLIQLLIPVFYRGLGRYYLNRY